MRDGEEEGAGGTVGAPAETGWIICDRYDRATLGRTAPRFATRGSDLALEAVRALYNQIISYLSLILSDCISMSDIDFVVILLEIYYSSRQTFVDIINIFIKCKQI